MSIGRKSGIVLIVLGALGVLVFVSCNDSDSLGTSEEAHEEEAIKMGYLPMVSSLTYFVALEQQFFSDAGLSVKGIPFTTSNKIAASLDAGDIDIGVELAVIPLLNQLKPGKEARAGFRIFSTSLIEAHNGFDSVVVAKDSTVKALKDLAGEKVAVFPGSTATNTLLEVFRRQFPKLAAPIPLVMAPALHIAAVERGEVVAAHAYEPFLSEGIVKHQMRRIATSLYAEQVSPNPIGVAAVNLEFLRDRRERAILAIRALDRAANFVEKYPDMARMIISEYTGTESDVAAVVNIMPMSMSKDVDTDGLAEYAKVLMSMGEILFEPDVGKIVFSAPED